MFSFLTMISVALLAGMHSVSLGEKLLVLFGLKIL